MDLSEALDEQRAFIEHDPHVAALLAAGPGTGKTWVLERRSEYLVESGVAPNSIAILTLTRSLAAELSDRIPHGSASTLHSFALRQLNMLREAWGRIVVSPWEQRELVRVDLALGHAISYGSACTLGDVDAFLTKLGASFRDDQDLPADLTPLEEQLRQVFLQHRELFSYRLMDELAYDLVRLIEAGTDLVRPPSHALVDEYQDLTAGELRLLQLMTERCGTTINAAGDDRQSIYGFREADPRALHRFPDIYGIQPDYLWRSKRCPRVVCGLANLIALSLPALSGLERPPLEPWPGRDDDGHVDITSYPSPKAEARAIVEQCRALVENGTPVTDITVVVAAYYRPVFAAILDAAAEANVDGLFADPRKGEPDVPFEMRLAATCARLLVDAADQLAWRTLVWAVPGLGQTRLRRILEEGGATYVARLRARAGVDGVVARAVAAGDAVVAQFGEEEEVDLREVVAIAAAALGVDLDQTSVDALGAEPVRPEAVAQRLFELDEALGDTDAVELAEAIEVHTIFSSKGLESDHVFLANAINESFAGRGDPADGLRMAYVAVTRASRALHISAPRYLRYTALGNQVGVESTRPADFLVDHCSKLGVAITVVPSS